MYNRKEQRLFGKYCDFAWNMDLLISQLQIIIFLIAVLHCYKSQILLFLRNFHTVIITVFSQGHARIDV
jgi:hypothetical protein